LYGLAHRLQLYLIALAVTAALVLLYTCQDYAFGDPPSLPPGSREEAVARKPQASSKCSELPIPSKYWSMTAADTMAFVDIPRRSEIEAGASVCVRVVVPAKALSFPTTFTPIPDSPWDSILLDLVGNATGISVPVQLEMATNAQNYHRDATHVYEADVVLRDADVYRPHGYIEFRGARWNPQDAQGPQPFEPEALSIDNGLHVSVVDSDGFSSFSLEHHLDLPLCTEADVDGRWVLASSLPFDTSRVLAPDHTGRVWLPYSCRMRPYTYQAYTKCLVQKYPLIHWYGDSNTRRALMKVTSHGTWCSDPKELDSVACTCKDESHSFKNFNTAARIASVIMDPATGGSTPQDPNDYATPVANKSRIVVFKWDGLTARNSPSWIEYFQRSVMDKLGNPSLTIFGATNWDTAFSDYTYFASQAEQLADKFATAYTTIPDLIIRTGQYYCCKSNMDSFWRRRYSRLRNHYFDRDLI
ncbi:hypothetical protein LPJ61_006455, partial [Coemansia biformis]